MNKPLTLGSLFDGSGTFPMMAMLSGIVPVWKSEIEPFPIAVTEKRLPFVKHLGDINSVNGAEIEPVDIITFGSPCTELSVVVLCLGLNAERSGLFFQAIRIIKEMSGAPNGKYPRFAVWENVTGAFSSNGGEDFRCVLEEFCKIKDADLSVPKPEKWTKAGEIMGENFSVAYRTFDAQYWGVPQRRMRVYLVADFEGGCASKILFESEGMSGYSAESFRAWLETAQSFGICSEETGSGLMFENHSQDTRYTGPLNVAQTVSATYGTGGNNQTFHIRRYILKNTSSALSQSVHAAQMRDNRQRSPRNICDRRNLRDTPYESGRSTRRKGRLPGCIRIGHEIQRPAHYKEHLRSFCCFLSGHLRLHLRIPTGA